MLTEKHEKTLSVSFRNNHLKISEIKIGFESKKLYNSQNR